MGRNTRNRKDSRSSKSFGAGFRNNSFNISNQNSSGPKETFPAKCSECNKNCDVPFKPATGKPIYCRECYKKRKEM